MPFSILSALLVLALCLPVRADAAPAQGPVLATGVPPVAWLALRVAGGEHKVLTLSGPGQNPHTFEPSPRQAAQMAEAAVYFSLDLPFEERLLPKVTAANPRLKVVDLAHGLDLLPAAEHDDPPPKQDHAADKSKSEAGHGHAEGELDRHVWMSPRICQDLARAMARELADLYPARAATYQANLDNLLADLREVDRELSAKLAPYKGREFMVYHPAFGYFARDYGLMQVPVETGDKEPGPRQLARLISQARKRNVRVIFVQPQFPQKSAQQVAREIGGVAAPMEDLSTTPLENWRRMAGALADGLAEGR